jgi:hypothetical protein
MQTHVGCSYALFYLHMDFFYLLSLCSHSISFAANISLSLIEVLVNKEPCVWKEAILVGRKVLVWKNHQPFVK